MVEDFKNKAVDESAWDSRNYIPMRINQIRLAIHEARIAEDYPNWYKSLEAYLSEMIGRVKDKDKLDILKKDNEIMRKWCTVLKHAHLLTPKAKHRVYSTFWNIEIKLNQLSKELGLDLPSAKDRGRVV